MLSTSKAASEAAFDANIHYGKGEAFPGLLCVGSLRSGILDIKKRGRFFILSIPKVSNEAAFDTNIH